MFLKGVPCLLLPILSWISKRRAVSLLVVVKGSYKGGVACVLGGGVAVCGGMWVFETKRV